MQPGDKVKFLNDIGEGIILSVKKKSALVLRDDGFEVHFPLDQLVPIKLKKEGPEKKEEEVEKQEIKPKEKDKKIIRKPNSKPVKELEVDLHIEELMEHYEGMSNGQILEVQLRKAEQVINQAITQRIRKVTFIHGVGTGKLKQELRDRLKGYEGIKFYDAPYKTYGWGATEVIVY